MGTPAPPPPHSATVTPATRRQLTVVRISLAVPGSSTVGELGNVTPDDQTRILFEVSIKGNELACLEATANEVGLPLTLAQARRSQAHEDSFEIPSYILAALERVVPYKEWPLGWPLWVSFPRYSGYLP